MAKYGEPIYPEEYSLTEQECLGMGHAIDEKGNYVICSECKKKLDTIDYELGVIEE